jgi:hypothetical protein
MTSKTPAVAALVAAMAALTIGGVAASSGAPSHSHAGMHMKGKASHGLARKLAKARVATAKYAFDLGKAKTAGYKQITPVMKNMGLHYLNPDIKGFNVTKPQILVYSRRDGRYQLGALEWVFPSKPKKAPLKGATYGSFPAACHYDDGSFVTASSQDDCAPSHNGAKFFFWHPDLVTLHVWLWYPNPDGLYASMNPFVAPFNRG